MKDLVAFVRDHTALARPSLVPEFELHLATEVTPLWHATQAWLDGEKVEPPFWAFAWAGGQALARFVLYRPEAERGKRVLDFACGGGIVALAAARAGALSVLAADVDALAITAAQLNAAHNACTVKTDSSDWIGRDLSGFDIVLAGDIFYDRQMAERCLAWLSESPGLVLVGDPKRTYAPARAERLASYDVPTSIDLEGVSERQTEILRL